MFDSKLRKQIGARAKQRRLELNLPMQYVADQLGVNKSTVQRYESGAIDNTKKMVLEGLSRVLDVTPEWLLGETEVFNAEVTDELELKIRDSYRRILASFPLKLSEQEADFAKTLLLFVLESYEELIPSFESASEKYGDARDYGEIPGMLGFNSDAEFRRTMYLGEIMHTVNNLKEASNVLQEFAHSPDAAANRLKNLLSFLPAETRS